VDLRIEGDRLVIAPLQSTRVRWDERFERMRYWQDDRLLDPGAPGGANDLRAWIVRLDVWLLEAPDGAGSERATVAESVQSVACVVLSPDEMNQYLRTAIVAPLVARGRPYPTRTPCLFEQRECEIVLDRVTTYIPHFETGAVRSLASACWAVTRTADAAPGRGPTAACGSA
jgi:mRNA-degrading endonuclease toxin of MazEF toxin-antitoxin module